MLNPNLALFSGLYQNQQQPSTTSWLNQATPLVPYTNPGAWYKDYAGSASEVFNPNVEEVVEEESATHLVPKQNDGERAGAPTSNFTTMPTFEELQKWNPDVTPEQAKALGTKGFVNTVKDIGTVIGPQGLTGLIAGEIAHQFSPAGRSTTLAGEQFDPVYGAALRAEDMKSRDAGYSNLGLANDLSYQEVREKMEKAAEDLRDERGDGYEDRGSGHGDYGGGTGSQTKGDEEGGSWDASPFNTGGRVMRNYLIAGGMPVAPEAPVAPAPAPMAPPVDPMMGQQPMAQPMPQPPARKTFAEKVAAAKEALKSEYGMSAPVEMGAPVAPADGQGDVGIVDHEGVFEPSMMGVGPDVGPDVIDGHLPEGSMVMNPEASEMFAEELQMMSRGGKVW